MKNCFDNAKYFKIQREEILKRIEQFGNKLYLEVGGKLFDDLHASRVLPGFEPSTKLKVLLGFKDICEIVIIVNTNDIESNKVRNDLGITYELEVERLINAYNELGLYVSSVVFSFYHPSKACDCFIKKLNKNGIKTYKNYEIKEYPINLDFILSKDGFGKNEYVETTRPLVVVTAPGPGSGKMSLCMSQLYLDSTKGLMSGYAKFETFPVWNLDINHPVNIAYEAATVDIKDYNVIDSYHYSSYGIMATSYNRDMEAFPLLNDIFERIYKKCPYKSPTDMGVNMVGFAITDNELAIESSKQEIIRRYYQTLKNTFLGKFDDSTLESISQIMNKCDVKVEERKCIEPCLRRSKNLDLAVTSIELDDGTVITGHDSPLLTASSACLLNALKYHAGIEHNVNLISPTLLEPVEELKVINLKGANPKLHPEEVLLILSIQSLTDELSKNTLDQLPRLKGLQAHSSELLPQVDLNTFNKIGMYTTEEPKGHAKKIYTKDI